MFRSKRRQKKLEEKRRKRAKRIKERKEQERYTTVGHVTIGQLEKVKKK